MINFEHIFSYDLNLERFLDDGSSREVKSVLNINLSRDSESKGVSLVGVEMNGDLLFSDRSVKIPVVFVYKLKEKIKEPVYLNRQDFNIICASYSSTGQYLVQSYVNFQPIAENESGSRDYIPVYSSCVEDVNSITGIIHLQPFQTEEPHGVKFIPPLGDMVRFVMYVKNRSIVIYSLSRSNNQVTCEKLMTLCDEHSWFDFNLPRRELYYIPKGKHRESNIERDLKKSVATLKCKSFEGRQQWEMNIDVESTAYCMQTCDATNMVEEDGDLVKTEIHVLHPEKSPFAVCTTTYIIPSDISRQPELRFSIFSRSWKMVLNSVVKLENLDIEEALQKFTCGGAVVVSTTQDLIYIWVPGHYFTLIGVGQDNQPLIFPPLPNKLIPSFTPSGRSRSGTSMTRTFSFDIAEGSYEKLSGILLDCDGFAVYKLQLGADLVRVAYENTESPLLPEMAVSISLLHMGSKEVAREILEALIMSPGKCPFAGLFAEYLLGRLYTETYDTKGPSGIPPSIFLESVSGNQREVRGIYITPINMKKGRNSLQFIDPDAKVLAAYKDEMTKICIDLLEIIVKGNPEEKDDKEYWLFVTLQYMYDSCRKYGFPILEEFLSLFSDLALQLLPPHIFIQYDRRLHFSLPEEKIEKVFNDKDTPSYFRYYILNSLKDRSKILQFLLDEGTKESTDLATQYAGAYLKFRLKSTAAEMSEDPIPQNALQSEYHFLRMLTAMVKKNRLEAPDPLYKVSAKIIRERWGSLIRMELDELVI